MSSISTIRIQRLCPEKPPPLYPTPAPFLLSPPPSPLHPSPPLPFSSLPFPSLPVIMRPPRTNKQNRLGCVPLAFGLPGHVRNTAYFRSAILTRLNTLMFRQMKFWFSSLKPVRAVNPCGCPRPIKHALLKDNLYTLTVIVLVQNAWNVFFLISHTLFFGVLNFLSHSLYSHVLYVPSFPLCPTVTQLLSLKLLNENRNYFLLFTIFLASLCNAQYCT